jgi:hypothetical protein
MCSHESMPEQDCNLETITVAVNNVFPNIPELAVKLRKPE